MNAKDHKLIASDIAREKREKCHWRCKGSEEKGGNCEKFYHNPQRLGPVSETMAGEEVEEEK